MQANVDEARRQLDRLREALATSSPREIEEILPELGKAIASMKELERALESGATIDAVMAHDLLALSQEIGIVRRLTDRGSELCNGWAVLLATAAGGYVASGKPAPLHPASSLELEG